MKFDQEIKTACWGRLMPIVLALSLAACGGEGGSSSSAANGSGGGKAEKGPATGRLLDSAVSGVAYAAASGAAGNTDENGNFQYTHGDMVEFKLGGLVLAKVKGAPIVTPLELAENDENRLQNLLVLLQSLDADGNPVNGISIPASAAAAVGPSIDLNADPAAFAASPELQKAREAGGVAGPIKTVEQAKAHFLSQGIPLLSTNIWVRHDDTSVSVIRISATRGGEYLEGDATPDDSCDTNRVCGGNLVSKAGVEYGVANVAEFDPRGFKFVGRPAIDTNLKAGLSHPRPTWRIRTDGAGLIASDVYTVQREKKQASLFGELFHIAGTLEISSDKEPIKTEVRESRYSSMENDPKGIVGAWAEDPVNIKTPTYFFFSHGKFMLVDPIGHPEKADSCGPGIEFASYVYDAGAKSLGIKGFTYDTNGCAGFSDTGPSSFSLSADGKTATLEKQDKSRITLYRVSR